MNAQSIPTSGVLLASATSVGLGTVAGGAPSGSTTALTPAVARAHQQFLALEQSTSTSISVLGRLKAHFAELADAAKALSESGAAATATDAAGAIRSFAAAYNNAVVGVRDASKVAGAETVAAQTLASISAALRSHVGPATLKKLGINFQSDGSIKLDSKAMEGSSDAMRKAEAQAMAHIGSAVQPLAQAAVDSPRVAASLNHLNGRLLTLKQQDNDLLKKALQHG